MTNQAAHRAKQRPQFPKRAVITAGMPYGNKELHFGHVGGVFIYADVFNRFLKDRIGPDNVIFVSGTDGYGSPIVESLQKKIGRAASKAELESFVRENHEKQKQVLDAYHINISLYSVSSLGRSSEIHEKTSAEILLTLHKNGYLKKMTTKQFYDPDTNIFLNGRQVQGRCPVTNCPSEKAYADECSLGHQYMPEELIEPKSTFTGSAPEMRDVTNWFVDLPRFRSLIKEWTTSIDNKTKSRTAYIKNICEFLEPPIIHVKRDQEETLDDLLSLMPSHSIHEGKTKALRIEFQTLEDREAAASILSQAGIRFRTGKTLVPFRLTGNIEWGLPIPTIDGLANLSWWVWPESLIAPVSFTETYLETHQEQGSWEDWWCCPDSQIFQFIGEDNVYFYGVAEIAMFLGLQSGEFAQINAKPSEKQMQLPQLIVNNHLLFLDKKASSSSEIKPPMAQDLLDHYTSDQLRAHFFALGLGIKSVSFKPKPLNPDAQEKDSDPVLKEGNLLTNVFNRVIRSCFYTAQKYTDGRIPVKDVSDETLALCETAVLKFERSMYRQEFHLAMACLDKFIRDISKSWTHSSKHADQVDQKETWEQLIIDSFHLVRVATVLMHPIAPVGTETVREYFKVDGDKFWNWNTLLKPITDTLPHGHQLKHLEPRTDFFQKHESQLKDL